LTIYLFVGVYSKLSLVNSLLSISRDLKLSDCTWLTPLW